MSHPFQLRFATLVQFLILPSNCGCYQFSYACSDIFCMVIRERERYSGIKFFKKETYLLCVEIGVWYFFGFFHSIGSETNCSCLME